jgi:hypothetical protein
LRLHADPKKPSEQLHLEKQFEELAVQLSNKSPDVLSKYKHAPFPEQTSSCDIDGHSFGGA